MAVAAASTSGDGVTKRFDSSALTAPATGSPALDGFLARVTDVLNGLRRALSATRVQSVRDQDVTTDPEADEQTWLLTRLSKGRKVALLVPTEGRRVTVKVDGSCSSSRPVTVTDGRASAVAASVNGASSYVLELPYAHATFAGDGQAWHVVSQSSNVLNVQSFGAKGDATTDDTTAIQAALTSYKSTTSATGVFFPPGNYVVTSTLFYPSRCRLFGSSKGFSTGGSSGTWIGWYGTGAALFQGDGHGTSGNRDVTFEDLTLYCNSAKQPGSVGVDLSDTGYSDVERCSIRAFDRGLMMGDTPGGPGGGYYNTVKSCEVIVNNIGIYGSTWTATHVFGGRFRSNAVGIEAHFGAGSHISSAFEGNAVGVHLTDGTGQCLISGSYFEGNTNQAILFDGGANGNVEHGNLLSNATDCVQEVIPAGGLPNVSLSPIQSSLSNVQHQVAPAVNLLSNGDFSGGYTNQTVSGGGGAVSKIPVGWLAFDPTCPAGTLTDLDPTTTRFGYGQSFKFAIAVTSSRYLYRTISVTPGKAYVLTYWYKMTGANAFSIRLGNAAAGATYHNSSGLPDSGGQWVYVCARFNPTQSTIYLTINENNPSVTATLWIDSFTLQYGLLPSVELLDTERFNRTTGATITAASTIAPTCLTHPLTGTTSVSTIQLPQGFTEGTLTFLPDSATPFGTGGNIAASFTATAGVPILAVYSALTGKWYLK